MKFEIREFVLISRDVIILAKIKTKYQTLSM
jgi:hypothetical protein